jgi:hypothetical protein
MKAKTKPTKIKDALEGLEIGQSIVKNELITSIWGHNDYFISRSFDVHFIKAKTQMPDKDFISKKGFLIRIK